MESLRLIVKIMDEQNRKRKEFLKAAVKDVPIKDDVLKVLSGIGAWEAHEIMTCHPGHDLDGKINSLLKALETYQTCHADLVTRLDEFDVAAKDGTLFGRPRTAELREHVAACRKEIFALSSAAAALEKMARHVRTNISILQFAERLGNDFDGGQHEFIKQLRNNLNHVTFLEADWSIKNMGPAQTSHFEFRAAELLRDGDFKTHAKAYLQDQREPIDVRNLFDSYRKSIERFYAWLLPEIQAQLPIEVQDYRECIRERRARLTRSWYQILFTQLVTLETDLYSHLPEYLTPKELEEIRALPHRSRQQIDRLVEIVDEYGACDDELRGLVYRAFGAVV